MAANTRLEASTGDEHRKRIRRREIDSEEAPRPRIGPRLRRARHHQGLTLEQIAKATGLSKSFLSQLERDGTSASVASLFKICRFLRISVASLLEPSGFITVRKGDRPTSSFGEVGVVDHLLTPPEERALQVIETHIEPGGTAGEKLWSTDADVDCMYVTSGRLEVRFADRTVELNEGDSLTLSPREPHTWRNPSSSRPTVVIFALTPSAP